MVAIGAARENGKVPVAPGRFDDPETAWKVAIRHQQQGFQIYFGLHKMKSGVAIHNNCIVGRPRNKATDMDRYKWAFLDIDPMKRTWETRRESILIARRLMKHLSAEGMPLDKGIVVFSGSGCQICIPVDMPPEKRPAITYFQKRMNDLVVRWSEGRHKVDLLNDLPRVGRAAGTLNLKARAVRAVLLVSSGWEPIPDEFFPMPPVSQRTATICFANWQTWRITDIWSIAGFRKEGNGEYGGCHPVHGGSPYSFKINPTKDLWLCNRHQVGGNAFQALAVDEAIVRCEEVVNGLKKEQARQVFAAARRRGLINDPVQILDTPVQGVEVVW
jgi:hypothetical protein